MIFLIRLGVHDGVSASSIYIGTDGFQSLPSDTPPNQFFMDRVKVAGSISRSMFSGGVTTGGRSEVGFGSITVVNGKPYGGDELIDDWIDLAFRTVQIESLASDALPLAQSKIRLIASVEQLVSTNALADFDIGIHDRLSDLDRPLLVNTYLGTTTAGGQGTAEGNTDLTDKIKQKLWGTVHNVPCVNVNAFDFVWQVSDGAVDSIVLYDGGFALTNAGDNVSLSSLLAATIAAGSYRTCLALGLVRTGTTPEGTVTADVVEGATTASRSAGQIATRMFTWFSAMYPDTLVSLSSTAVTALDALNAAECGVLVQDTENALDAIMRVLSSVGAWMLPTSDSASVFEVGRFGEPDGTIIATYDLDDNIGGSPSRVESGDQGRGIPAYKIILEYDQIGQVQKGTEIFPYVDDTNPTKRAYLGQEWRSAQAQDTGLLTQYPNAPTITRQTRLINLSDAQAEATRLLALYSVRRDIYQMKLPMSEDPTDDPGIGEVVELISVDGRMGLGTVEGDGKRFLVIGRDDDFSDTSSITLTIWG